MILLEKQEIKVQELFARIRLVAEQKGIEFTDLALEMETEAAETASSNMDFVGFMVHMHYAVFIATVISITEYKSLKAGHDWLHTWLSATKTPASCNVARGQTMDFIKFLIEEDRDDITAFMRRLWSERLDVEEIAMGISEATMTMLEEAGKVMGDDKVETMQADILAFCRKFSSIFAEYATAENGLQGARTVGDTLMGILPMKALGTYLANAIAAVNWGLVDPGLIGELKRDNLVGEKVQGFSMGVGGPDLLRKFKQDAPDDDEPHDGDDDDAFEQFKAFFE